MRHALEFCVRVEIVPRVQADENLRIVAPLSRGHGSKHHAQHVVVMRIQLPRRRRERDEPARRIGADPAKERLARRHEVVAKIHVPLRRARDSNLCGRIAVQIDSLLLHQVVPDDQPVDTPDGKQLVRKIVPAWIHRHRAHSVPHGGPQQRHLRVDQSWTRCHEQGRPMAIEEPLGRWMGDRPIDELIPAFFPYHRWRDEAGQPPFRADPPDRAPGGCFSAPDAYRFGDARIDVGRLNQRHQPAFEPRGPMGRQILEANTRMLELANERRVLDERRDENDLRRLVCVEQPADQSGPEHVAG